MLETCYIARMCFRLWVTSSCIIILIHQQWNRLHHKAAKSVLWLGFWISFWEVINYDVEKILTSRLVKIETWTIWTYSILLLTKMSYFCTIESVKKWHRPEANLQNFYVIHTNLAPSLARAYDRAASPHHDLFPWPPVVNSVHLPSAAVSGCMQSVSAALVIGDPVLQCCHLVPTLQQW